MPAMFFVAGALMVQSLERGNALDVLYRRFKRLLIPLWVMAILAIGLMLAYDLSSQSLASEVHERSLIWWLFPVWDPQGSIWGITWWAPLWYLRAIVWLMLASPVLLWIWRRTGPALLLVPVGALAVIELRNASGTDVPWQFQ